MDNSIEISTILAIAGAVTAVGGAWLTIIKLNASYRKQRDLEAAKILHSAKEEISKTKTAILADRVLVQNRFEARLEALEQTVETNKESVEKDMQHIRETYNGEIRNLGQKIEDLRSELRNQHGQLVGLLTKMIENKD